MDQASYFTEGDKSKNSSFGSDGRNIQRDSIGEDVQKHGKEFEEVAEKLAMSKPTVINNGQKVFMI